MACAAAAHKAPVTATAAAADAADAKNHNLKMRIDPFPPPASSHLAVTDHYCFSDMDS